MIFLILFLYNNIKSNKKTFLNDIQKIEYHFYEEFYVFYIFRIVLYSNIFYIAFYINNLLEFFTNNLEYCFLILLLFWFEIIIKLVIIYRGNPVVDFKLLNTISLVSGGIGIPTLGGFCYVYSQATTMGLEPVWCTPRLNKFFQLKVKGVWWKKGSDSLTLNTFEKLFPDLPLPKNKSTNEFLVEEAQIAINVEIANIYNEKIKHPLMPKIIIRKLYKNWDKIPETQLFVKENENFIYQTLVTKKK